jgi:PAS domain S-box-containing protein
MGWLSIFEKEKPSAQTGEKSDAPLNVLVIDDEPDVTETLRRYISMENYHVLTAGNGADGYQKYLDFKPQIIITDIKMPGMSGLELLKKIRSLDSEIEIIVVSGHAEMDNVIEALQNQASDYILKPFDLNIILLALERAVGRHKLRQQVKSYTVDLERMLKQVNYSKHYLATIVRNSPHALITYDENGKINSWNEQAEQITGYQASDVLGRPLNTIFSLEGHLIDFNDIRTDQVYHDVISQVLTRENLVRFVSRNANILRNEKDEAVGGIESFVDITDHIKNERLLEKRYLQVQTINEIGKQVAGSIDLIHLCDFICNHLNKTFFESSQISLYLFDEVKKCLTLTSMSGQQIDRMRLSQPIGSAHELNKGILGRVFSSGQALLCEDLNKCDIDNAGIFPDSICEFAFPVRSKERIFGVINIENNQKMLLDEADTFMLEAIAEYLGISTERIELLEKITRQNQLLEMQAIELRDALKKVGAQKEIIEQQNERLINDLKKAADFQMSLLPIELPKLDTMIFATTYLPSSQLGGDFYDIFPINDDCLAICIADASGHGVAAAMLSAMFKMTLHKYASESIDPGRVLELLNRDFCHVLQMGDFFTSFFAIYYPSTGKLVYCNAAHPRALLYDYHSKTSSALDTDGFLLGVSDLGIGYEQKEFTLTGKFRMLLYTDGLSEAIDGQGQQFGEQRIMEGLQRHSKKNSAAYLQLIRDELSAFTGADNFNDDITLVVVDFLKNKPAPAKL